MNSTPTPLDLPCSWSLNQNIHFQRVFRAVCDSQHTILPASFGPVSPAQWREIADQIARIAAQSFEVLPDLELDGPPAERWGGVERRAR